MDSAQVLTGKDHLALHIYWRFVGWVVYRVLGGSLHSGSVGMIGVWVG
jgi:hypothetical protein